MLQFVSEFIIESVEYLERIANEVEPPLSIDQIEDKKYLFDASMDSDWKDLKDGLVGMERAFKKTGDLSRWSAELLDEIDAAFVKHYLDDDGEPIQTLFFPGETQNLNNFAAYCKDVEQALRKHASSGPPHARAYFVYYSIWQMRGWKFPVPLGTASVVGALNKILKRVKNGFAEVSSEYSTDTSRVGSAARYHLCTHQWAMRCTVHVPPYVCLTMFGEFVHPLLRSMGACIPPVLSISSDPHPPSRH